MISIESKRRFLSWLKKFKIVQNNFEFLCKILYQYRDSRLKFLNLLEKTLDITFYKKEFLWFTPDNIFPEYDLVAIIAFQDRHNILRDIINEIFETQSHHLKIGVVLACSKDLDFQFAKEMQSNYKQVGVVHCKNNPLGNKWQIAINCARTLNPKTIMIVGSDDFISSEYIYNNYKYVCENNSNVMLGAKSWYMLDYRANKSLHEMPIWKISYKNHISMPLGAGRIYNAAFLDEINWQIFDRNLNTALDNKGYDTVLNKNKLVVYADDREGFILSIKGNWQAINSLKDILYETKDIILDKLNDEENRLVFNKMNNAKIFMK